MKKAFLGFLAIGATMLFSSCGSNVLTGEGEKTTEVRTVKAFDAIDVSLASNLKVNVSEGADERVELVGYGNVMKHVKTEVKGGVLHVDLDLDDSWEVEESDLEVRIAMPSIKAMSLSGTTDAEVAGTIKGRDFSLDVSGAGAVVVDNVQVDNLAVDLSGAAGLKIKSGTARLSNMEMSGVGGVDAEGLQTEETIASLSGAGGAKVWATKKLDASISGAGSIKYRGQPEVAKHISGLGSISAID